MSQCYCILSYMHHHNIVSGKKTRKIYYFITLTFMKADTISSGNYLIVDCAEHADAIANILQMTLAHLPRAVIINTSAYQAFLKGVNPYKVTSLFTSISRGVNFTDVRISERPTLACLTGPASYWRAYWAACVELGISALWQQETQTIILCPIFWNAHTLNVFPEPEDCDIVNQENTGFVVPDRVWSNQYSILVHELVHLYFRQVFWKQSILHNEPYNVNTCMGLVPDLKEINAHNYAYYVASKLTVWITFSPILCTLEKCVLGVLTIDDLICLYISLHLFLVLPPSLPNY